MSLCFRTFFCPNFLLCFTAFPQSVYLNFPEGNPLFSRVGHPKDHAFFSKVSKICGASPPSLFGIPIAFRTTWPLFLPPLIRRPASLSQRVLTVV